MKFATEAMQSTLNLKTDPASALVSINPKNGAIRAMTAEIPGKKNNQFNLAAQGRRQAGSSFKTFVLTEAGQVRKLKFLDVVLKEAGDTGKEEDGFDANVAILAGELSQLIPDLLEALGGEAEVAAQPEAVAA